MSNGPAPKPSLPAAVPLFPLPNVVQFPHTVLPLHIFEERYKKMTADMLHSHKQIAMAVLRPGWEKDYYGRPAIEPVVCVGKIVSHERLADGRYNFLLEGHTRAKIVRESSTEPYRVAELEPLHEVNGEESNLLDLRSTLLAVFRKEAVAAGLPSGRQIRELLIRGVPTPAVADLVAFHVLGEHPVDWRQQVLAEPDVRKRVAMVTQAVAAIRPSWMNVPDDAHLN